ncbi:hypothetical protein AV955_gp100 [Diadromus pulchellus ascovirus 4a]|uniref:Complete DpAV4 genome n=1 Tax=Diadromus pulchellus ascovirus 4a TaxID=158683 RepID=F2NZ29_9VIRU|nr:hypothetical protein AV955_gp100 [Diadromus pulchellus ascovirus 4a]CCA61457.1 unnamed protein product [Diadromus pulchellus ascovirus 4a]
MGFLDSFVPDEVSRVLKLFTPRRLEQLDRMMTDENIENFRFMMESNFLFWGMIVMFCMLGMVMIFLSAILLKVFNNNIKYVRVEEPDSVNI